MQGKYQHAAFEFYGREISQESLLTSEQTSHRPQWQRGVGGPGHPGEEWTQRESLGGGV